MVLIVMQPLGRSQAGSGHSASRITSTPPRPPSGSERYARNDELWTPLGITIDCDTLRDGSVILGARDFMAQVRGSEDDVVQAVRNMVDGVEIREQAASRLPISGARARTDE